MIKNTRYGKRFASYWQSCKPSRRELRAAMMIPLIYEQLKRTKLKIHKARCVRECVLSGSNGWARGTLKGLGNHLETPAFILQRHACWSSKLLRFPWFQSSPAQQTLSLTLSSREIMRQNLCLGLYSVICDFFFLLVSMDSISPCSILVRLVRESACSPRGIGACIVPLCLGSSLHFSFNSL